MPWPETKMLPMNKGVIKSGWESGDWKVARTRSLERPRYGSADIRAGGSGDIPVPGRPAIEPHPRPITPAGDRRPV